MPSGKVLSEHEKGQIDAFKKAGYSNRHVAKMLNRSPRVVNNYVNDPDNYGKNQKKRQSTVLSERDRRQIIKKATNSSLSVNQIRSELGLKASHTTVWRVISNFLRLRSVKLKKKIKLPVPKESRISKESKND